MITQNDFLNRWDISPLVTYNTEFIRLVGLSEEDGAFLQSVGLPSSASPFLSFVSPNTHEKAPIRLPTGLYLIGNTIGGDYVCLKDNNGGVVLVDHEDMTRITFMNSSIMSLATFLYNYKAFVDKIKQINGRRAVIERNAPQELVKQLQNELSQIDVAALHHNSFWGEVVGSYIK